mgnify:CR=1 FL=1|jgi:general secretion pathway protein A
MYLDFFQLQRTPFHVTPDPAFLYASPGHREALSALIYGVMLRKGFIALTGEVGMGKTTLLRAFLEQVDPDQTKIIYLLNSNLSFDDLIKSMLQEFGVVLDAEHAFSRMDRLHLLFIEQFRQGRNVVLVIDEAQNMPTETLEGLRVLSNLETATDKLLQIIFCGQPEFDDKLNQSDLRQLKQRIVVRATIMPLARAEAIQYIQHRLALAGAENRVIFTPGAIREIVKEAQGIPRLINILCDNALVTAFGYQKRPVSRNIVREVIADRKAQTRPPVRRWRVLGVGVAATILAAGIFLNRQSHFSDFNVLLEAPWPLLERILPMASRTVQWASGESEFSAPDGASTGPVPNLTKGSGPADGAKVIQQAPPIAQSAAAPTPLIPMLTPNSPTGDAVEQTAAQTAAAKSAANKAGKPGWVTRIVKPGDRLIDLVEAVYGSRDDRWVQQVQRYNSHIKNSHVIHVGDRLVFPPADHQESGQ